MSKVNIVTDSVSCLPAEIVEKYDIRVVPFNLIMNQKSYRDQLDITPEEFWRIFKESKELPTTSAPSPGAFATIFQELGKSTDSIVGIFVSRGLTVACEAAAQAKEMVREELPDLNIGIIDSRNAAGAQGYIVMEAARAAQAGKNQAEVVKIAQEMIPKVKYVFSPGSLKYLIKGGRAPKTAYIGELMQVKPILGMVSGSGAVDSLGKVRGKRNAVAKLVDMVAEYTDTSKPIHAMVHYTDSLEDGEELKKMVTSRYNCAEMYLTPYTPVMACHTGPSLLIAFYS